MSQIPGEILYPLLPGFHRQSDANAGEPLRALLAVLERELRLVDASISQSYENWFIETCEEWVVPYIAELLAVKRLPTVGSASFNQRTYVANILAYRRRKGATSLLSQLTSDLSGWTARIVEYFRLVATAQHLTLPKQKQGPVELRSSQALRRLGGPFDTLSHVAELRNIPRHSGRYNLPSVGLFLWRLRSYRVPTAVAGVFPEDVTGRKYTFDPLGREVPLFNPDRTQPNAEPQEWDVPAALKSAVLKEDLKLLSKTPVPPLNYFGADPVVRIYVNGSTTPIQPAQILIASLEPWSAPFDMAGNYKLAIDPERGRILFSNYAYPGTPPLTKVEVSYNYGFSCDMGGGPYDRLDPAVALPAPNLAVSSRSLPPGGKATLLEAITALDALTSPPSPFVIEIQDSERYAFPERLKVPANVQLIIRAANLQRPSFVLAASTQPAASPPASSVSGVVMENNASLSLDGLLIGSGILRVYAGDNNKLSLRHTTLVPTADATSPVRPSPSVQLMQATSAFSLSVERCITGSLILFDPASSTVLPSTLTAADSIVDGVSTASLTLSAFSATLERCTILGRTAANLMPLASDCIFTGVVQVTRTQPGCVRFCYVPSIEPDSPMPPTSSFSITPPRYRCQPDGALADKQTRAERQALRDLLKPSFTSTSCGQPGYAQLSFLTSHQIRRGGSDGSEQGAFFALHQPLREGNLTAALQEFLRFGYEAGVFFLN